MPYAGMPISNLDDRYVNVTGDVMTGGLLIDGATDEVQLTVQAVAGQSANLQEWENSAGSALTYVDPSGDFVTKQHASFGSLAAAQAYEVIRVRERPTTNGVNTKGLYVKMENNAASPGTITGLENWAQYMNTGTTAAAYALSGYVKNSSSGTITSGIGITAQIQNTGTGTIQAAEGIRLNNPVNSGGGTIANSYALYIQSQTAGNVNYAIFTGTGQVVFGDRVSIDQASSSAAVPVLKLDQGDVSEEMIEFVTTIGVGNAIEAIAAKALTTTHFIKVTLPGSLTRYIPVGTIA